MSGNFHTTSMYTYVALHSGCNIPGGLGLRLIRMYNKMSLLILVRKCKKYAAKLGAHN